MLNFNWLAKMQLETINNKNITFEREFQGDVFYPGNQINSILIMKLRHIGDVLLITPLIKTLKTHYPNTHIDVMLYQGTESILKGNKNIRRVFTIKKRENGETTINKINKEVKLFKSLNKNNYDLVLNLSDQWRCAVYTYLMKPRFSIGFDWPRRQGRWWKKCHQSLVSVQHHDFHHVILNNLSILSPLKMPNYHTELDLCWQDDDVDALLTKVNSIYQGEYIVIHPNARWKFKVWTEQSYVEVINFLTHQGRKIILSGSKDPEDIHLNSRIMAQIDTPESVLDLSGKISLSELSLLLSKAKLFVGVDSAPMHMAAALGIPSVVLFGPSNRIQWHPWQENYSMIWAGEYRDLPEPNQVDTNTTEQYLAAIPTHRVIAEIKMMLISK